MLFWFSGFVALAVFLSGRICFGMVSFSPHTLFHIPTTITTLFSAALFFANELYPWRVVLLT
jgi:hypothetical protein